MTPKEPYIELKMLLTTLSAAMIPFHERLLECRPAETGTH
jgi:hypothetical protein